MSAIFGQGMTGAKVPPPPRDRAEVEAVLAKAVRPSIVFSKKIILLADVKDHGENEHDYPLWQKRWALLLGGKNAADACETQVNLFGPAVGDYNEFAASRPCAQVETAWQWPSEEQFKTAEVIVAYCYLNWNPERIKQVERYLSNGGGLVVVHPASWTKPEPSEEVAKLVGISGYKLYRHGLVDLKIIALEHPVCKGLPQKIRFDDEAYWPAVIQTDIEVLATSDEKVGKDANDVKPQTIFWTHRYGKGRVFGCVLGHNMWTFDDPYFRILLLRGMAWAAGESPYHLDLLALRGASLKDVKE
ncbi:MAG: ThuA domain-containing protein [Sedimentisphaerales bacterium]|nr:ThuA domain-containing protein [Sedimentisphaerales bacterium]